MIVNSPSNFFVIPDRLCSLNEYQSACRSHWSKGAKLKKDMELIVSVGITKAIRGGTLRPITEQSIIRIEWHERTKKRDVDNIQSGQKFILDQMQHQNILPNDSRRYVAQIYHEIIDDVADFVVVKIEKKPSA